MSTSIMIPYYKRHYTLLCSLVCFGLQLVIHTPILQATRISTTNHHRFHWRIQLTEVTRLCHTKYVVSVNGQFPGPTVYVREGDSVAVRVTNLVRDNVTIHWHGLRQLLSAWADGPAYITQCPIQTRQSSVYRFKVIDQRGTLFWHAHISWLRATLYGAFIILPQEGVPYPFPTPTDDFPILLGEWWKADVEEVIAEALETGGGYNFSDALTINGQPGDLYPCSQEGTQVLRVERGRRYLLRVINAGVNFQMYFGVAGHNLTVVEADAEYTKPYTTPYIVLAPGQTTNVLLTAAQPRGNYYMAASIFSPAPRDTVNFTDTPATAILSYEPRHRRGTDGAVKSSSSAAGDVIPATWSRGAGGGGGRRGRGGGRRGRGGGGGRRGPDPHVALGALPEFPSYDDVAAVQEFSLGLRSQSYSKGYYYMRPSSHVDEHLFFTVGYSLRPCAPGDTCDGPNGQRLSASVNNISIVNPPISILEAYYNQINNVYESDFPDNPPYPFDYTGNYTGGLLTVQGTKVKVLEFNQTVQIVYQDTSILFFESHPIHLHGQNFYIVGSGFGNFDKTKDPNNFNLVDPPYRNTISVPSGGWAAVQFTTTNPGVWYMHCHIDLHNSWGMAMAFIVEDGNGYQEILPPPPSDLPPC